MTRKAPSTSNKGRPGAVCRLLRGLAGFILVEGSLALLVLACALVVARSIQNANWAETPSLAIASAAAVAIALAFCRLRLPSSLPFLLGYLAGLFIALWMTSTLVTPKPGLPLLIENARRTFMWVRAAANGGISSDALPVTFFLTFLVWLTAFSCLWLVLRSKSYWAPVLIMGTVLVVNMSLLEQSNKVDFFLFLLPALLLRVRMRSLEVQIANPRVNKKRGLSVLRDGFLFTSAIMAAAFMLPSGKDIRSLDGFYNVLHSPVERYSTKFDRLFAGLYARIPGGTRVFGEQMALGGRVELSDVPLLIVQSPKPVYLGARAYDTYTSSGWTLGATEMYDLAVATPAVEGREPSSQIKVTPLFASEQRFVPVGGILQIDKPTDAEVLSATVYAVNFRNASQVAGLPDSIRSAARTIQAAARPSGSRQSPSLPGVNNLQPLIPPDIALLDVSYDRGYVAVARLMLKEPVPLDLASVRVKGGPSSDAYTTSNYASRPGPEQLEAAVSDYSLWIRDHYLQLPSTLPKRVRDLAHDVAADLATPYDKAIAIEYYLRNNIGYSTAIDAPPYNQDGVDYFLFGIKEGYCDYFASAMAVMLRSVGVPARVVSGFAPGEKAGEGSYLVRDRDAHSWPQVYFPGYGWVEFEPTPSRPGTGEPELDLSLFPDMEIPEEEFMEEEEFPMEPGIPVIPAEGQAAINWLVWGILLPGLALIVGGFAVTWRRIGSIPLSPEAGYARLLLLSRLGGMPAAASQTPYEFASTVGRRWPEAEREVWRVADSYVVASFSKARHTDRPNAENWPKIRSAFLRRLFWRPKQSSSF